MRIVVPIKQVPESSDVTMDPETGTIRRAGRNAVVNPLDLYAIETALRLRETHGGTISVISMGPMPAIKALREAIAMGCDDACLLSDRRFSGSDTWATSYVLSRGILSIGEFDLIICGERATDGDTAQVGPGIASWLDVSLATYVATISSFDSVGNLLAVERLVEDGYQSLELSLPALITVVKEIAEPRLPTLEGKKRATGAAVPVRGFDDLDLDPTFVGLAGSPTKVIKIRRPQITRGGRRVEADGDVPGAVTELVRFLKSRGLV